jgi:hypothetical protein
MLRLTKSYLIAGGGFSKATTLCSFRFVIHLIFNVIHMVVVAKAARDEDRNLVGVGLKVRCCGTVD